MTNFEQLMNDREKLIDVLAGNEEFMMTEVESEWCGGACPHKDQCREAPEFHPCLASTSDMLNWWFEQEATN